jgi:hypothetical protein
MTRRTLIKIINCEWKTENGAGKMETKDVNMYKK